MKKPELKYFRHINDGYMGSVGATPPHVTLRGMRAIVVISPNGDVAYSPGSLDGLTPEERNQFESEIEMVWGHYFGSKK